LAIGPAIASDPVSAFGSVIACNRTVDVDLVEGMGKLFVECLVAPDFTPTVLDQLSAKKNLRVLRVPIKETDEYELRSIVGGYLRQSIDQGDPEDAPEWKTVTQRAPSDAEMAELKFAWKVCQHVKSNAVVLASSEGGVCYTVGIGGGQPNRLDCVRISGERAGERAAKTVMASDAFFPFPDGVEAAAALGVTAIVQPGGAMRDKLSIEAADKAGMAMVFTGIRHFRH
jgi:phosphoribosylaminoimidazolecarboxamide formyltransferase/IMP cyclohydrolase